MIELFKRSDDNSFAPGLYKKELVDDARWVLTEPSVATREYDGVDMRNTSRGWEFYNYDEWQLVFPKTKLFKTPKESAFLWVDQFDKAEVLFTNGEYPIGDYWLIPDPDDPLLIPVDYSEQLSNINELNLNDLTTDVEVFDLLYDALTPLRGNVHGVILTSRDGDKRAKVSMQGFDWTNN